MKISRRRFLALGGISGIAALYGTYLWHRGEPTRIIVAILKYRVGYLNVEQSTFDDFAKSYLASREKYRRQLGTLSLLAPLLTIASPYGWFRQGQAYRRLEDNVVSMYLLSTDFFENGADERRVVTYRSFHDPYRGACNPFVRRPTSG